MNRTVFFDALRKAPYVFGEKLTQAQVAGTEAILDACIGYPAAHTAHVLAEVHHETGGGMLPVKETVFPYSKNRNPSDAEVISRLDHAFSSGKLPWVKEAYWREGWFGRGGLQLTHKENYRKASALVGVDLVSDPSRALDLDVSAKVAAAGCRAGIFTGKKLADFDGPSYDHYNARSIVNGDKKAKVKGEGVTVGKKIERCAKSFEAALAAGGWTGHPPPPPDIEPPSPRYPDVEVPGANFWTRLIAILSGLFKR